MNKQKNLFSFQDLSKYRSVLMGLGILLIIFFHYTNDCYTYNVRYEGFIKFFHTYIRSSGVDLFLFLSGLGLYYSWSKHPNPVSFYKKRFLQILIPYFIVSLPAWYWLDFFVLHKDFVAYLQDIFFVSLFTEGSLWYWYIFIIIICYLIFPWCYCIIKEAPDKTSEQMRVLTLCITVILLTVILQLYNKELYSNIKAVIIRFPLFFVGILAGKYSYNNQIIPKRNIYILVIIAIIIDVPLKMGSMQILGYIVLAVVTVSLCLLFIIFLNYLEEHKNTVLNSIYSLLNRSLSWLGKYTLEIYLLHVTIRTILNRNGLHTYRLSYFAIEILTSIILAVILKKITTFIYNKLSVSQ